MHPRRLGAVGVIVCALVVPASPAAPLTCDNDGKCVSASASPALRRVAREAHRPMAANEAVIAAARGYCRTPTADGEIVIACDLSWRMTGFIADVVARGFKGRVHCFSLSPRHVRGSLHFSAQACDFAQRGWGKTVKPMYRVGDLAAKWGLRDGCTFKDCGHIDSGIGRSLSAHKRHIVR